jgi:hypothetical protein
MKKRKECYTKTNNRIKRMLQFKSNIFKIKDTSIVLLVGV